MKILDIVKKICYNIGGQNVHKFKKGEVMGAIALSNYIISIFDSEKSPITNLKLQKVLYYVQGYFYKRFKKYAFEEELYNWQYGPVVPTVYYQFNSYHSSRLTPISDSCDLDLQDCEKNLIKEIVQKCIKISTSQLVSMTHSETPWKHTFRGDIIDKQIINRYFMLNDPLELYHE